MTRLAGFSLVMTAGFFSMFLLAWSHGSGFGADWVYGFLAIFWSLIMMLRLMSLTEPMPLPEASGYLAQKIIRSLHEKQEQARDFLLKTSFGGSFLLFVFTGFSFAAWQIYCAANPSAPMETALPVSDFLSRYQDRPMLGKTSALTAVFDWGQGFMLLLSFFMMAFVMRTYAAEKTLARPALLIVCAYAVAGFILTLGLGGQGLDSYAASLSGNGSGSIAYLTGGLREGEYPSIFGIILVESGVVGLAILTFLLFIPLGCISLSSKRGITDNMVLCCGMLLGSMILVCVFQPFTPVLCGTAVLCLIGLFLAWGTAESAMAQELLV
ncbi:MAG: hypothetical protein DI551_04510 [Micavibrio aeruginosavorus]|uniref:Uncharacterized protein n=1 Tax=Micavibrio aeruginosavorus TaxID=349221 RepID=A0A2W5N0C5_9BACT|nr:MAG: hypothetical protein DI551_04510 [Micavibrio aeruginosavorus]